MTKTAKPTSTAPEALMLDIAKRHFLVETLDTRNSDGWISTTSPSGRSVPP